MNNATKWLIGIPSGLVVLLGGCCVFGALVGPKPAHETHALPVVAAAPQAPTTAGQPSAPPAPDHAAERAAWAALVAKHAAGEALDPPACAAAISGWPASQPAERWPIFVCAWSAASTVDSPDSPALEIAVTMLETARLAAPPREARRAFEAAMMLLAEHPRGVSGVRGSIFDLTHDQFVTGIERLEQLTSLCSRCGRVRDLRDHLGWLRYWNEHYPLALQSVETLKLRHLDMREQPVKVRGHMSAATYHNCNYGSTSRWRAFSFSDHGGMLAGLSGMHVYCEAGVAWCDELYSRAVDARAQGDDLEVEALVVYPQRNRICEEDQAELRGARDL